MAPALRAPLNSRQVYIRMNPAPRTIAQSRSVLHSLQRFGEVNTFLNTKYFKIRTSVSGSSAFAIFDSPQAAADAISASPLTVSLPRPSKPDTFSDTERLSECSPSDASGTIECVITDSNYDHKSNMRQNPYNMSFQISRHWHEVQELVRSRIGRVPILEFADCFPKRKFSMPFRVQDKYYDQVVKAGGTSLMRMWKEGLEAKEANEEMEGNGKHDRDSAKK